MNLVGKIDYLLKTVNSYRNWYVVFYDRIFGSKTNHLSLRNGLEIYGGSESTIADLVWEIFIQKVYTPGFIKVKKGDVVMDIGANIGVFSLYAESRGVKKIYVVEPFPENVRMISKNFLANSLSEPIIIQTAVSNENGKRKIYTGDLDSHGSLFQNLSDSNEKSYIYVSVCTLKNIFTKHRINHVDFLKIDCEGSEGNIIGSIKKDTWKKIDKISIEYHDKVSSLSHRQIENVLKKNGFDTFLVETGSSYGYIYARKQ